MDDFPEAAPSLARSPDAPPAYAGLRFVRLRQPQPTEVFDTYWRFASERQRVFVGRLRNESSPWTPDEILQRFKFTNVYRATDRVSQFLIRHVIYDGQQRSVHDTVLRILLFKLFNRVETWKRLSAAIGEICLSTFSVDDFNQVLTTLIDSGERLYSAAYIMPAALQFKSDGASRKHTMHLKLIRRMLDDGLADRLSGAGSMAAAFSFLRRYPSIGDFLAYQLVTDINYSTVCDFSEAEFVVPGPGARDGIRKCFTSLGDLTEADTIRWTMEVQEQQFERLGLHFLSLGDRPMQLIDCQNVFCEVDKYARVKHPLFAGRSGRTRIKQRFSPSSGAITAWCPPKWNVTIEHFDPSRPM